MDTPDVAKLIATPGAMLDWIYGKEDGETVSPSKNSIRHCLMAEFLIEHGVEDVACGASTIFLNRSPDGPGGNAFEMPDWFRRIYKILPNDPDKNTPITRETALKAFADTGVI